ncbi:hypothetical protein SRHO_G00258510 [Serrasalmus rhombeus]
MQKFFWWLFLVVSARPASSASQSLQYLYTAVTPGLHFPEFISVGLLDGEQFIYYDSNIIKKIPKTEWMEKNEGEDYWKEGTETSQHHQEEFRHDVINLMKRFNQTGGFHTLQQMYGCELDADGAIRGFWLYGYDGEDFISFDLNTETWTAAHPKAVITKRRWDSQKVSAAQVKAYLENECTAWLQKYVEYSRSSLERKVPPEVSLFQKDSSSPVVCHATGFFPKAVMISWQKDGEDLHEDVELRETLPNQDGTFQKRSVLTVSAEELKKNEYTCVVQHSGLEKEVVLRASGHTGGGSDDAVTGDHQFSAGIAVGLVALLLVFVGIVFMWWWRRKTW